MKLISCFLLLSIATGLNAQVLTKTDVRAMRIQNSGAFLEGNEVKGYYFFFEQEKKNQNINRFLLVLTDENLVEINSIPIVRPNSFTLMDVVFNGHSFAFLGYDLNSKMAELLTFNKDLVQTASVVKALNGIDDLTGIVTGIGRLLTPVYNLGFLLHGVKQRSSVPGSMTQYQLTFYNNDLKVLWVDPSQEMEKIEFATEAFQDSVYLGSIIGKMRKGSSKNVSYDLLVQETLTGKRLFRTPIETSNSQTLTVSTVYFDKGAHQFVVFGEYYNPKDKERKDQSVGLAALIYDTTGKLIGERLNSWNKEISEISDFDKEGKLDGSNIGVLFHETIRTSDGQLFLVGEQYKKTTSALSVVATYGLGATSQINVYNLVLFQFNPDYTISRVHMFQKTKKEVPMAATVYSSSKALAEFARVIGGFDYAFSQQSSDRSTFTLLYRDRTTSQGTTKHIFKTITYTPEKTFAKDEIPLTSRSSEFRIFKAKEGYIMVSEYFRKEKKLENRLEKINY